MENFNIVDLIENNPITKLSNTYNNKLLIKIKENFTNEEQQLFISSFYCYLNYDQTNDYVIDLDNIWKWLDFSQKVNAKKILQRNFKINIDYKLYSQHELNQNTSHGGNNKETIMLNIKTFKLFCIKADTKKANELHEYYIKLENILYEIIQEECNELKLQLEKKDIELLNNKYYERQEILLNQYATTGPLIYIIKVKTYEDNSYVIKIGESRKGILARFNEHKSNYEEILLLDCFLVNNSKDFESFLHNHKKIKYNKVSDLKNHENEKELFLIGKNLSYSILLNIIKSNIKQFDNNNLEIEKINSECEKLKLLNSILENDKLDKLDNFINNLIDTNKILLDKIDKLEKSNNEILNKLNSINTRTTTNFNEPLVTLGPRLQKINPDTFTIVKVYESVSECMKEDNQIRRPSINKAINENTIYKGYRWLYVNRDLDPNIIHNIDETKETKIHNVGYIAKLNKDKTEIINVYLDKKIACKLNDYKSTSALDNPVKNFTLTRDNYYTLYDNCSDILKNNFESKYGKPILYTNGIAQYDSNNNLINEFTCKKYCMDKLRISDKTLIKALENGNLYNNCYFKYIGSKLKWL